MMQPLWKTRIKDILNAGSINFLFGLLFFKINVKYLCVDLPINTNIY